MLLQIKLGSCVRKLKRKTKDGKHLVYMEAKRVYDKQFDLGLVCWGDEGAEDYSIRDVFDHFKDLKKDPDLLFVFDLEELH